jgi:NADPH-dependent glutamate synthase beta subunit-like oxidoreductase
MKLGGTPDSVIPGERYATATDEIGAILSPALKAGRLEVRFGEALGKKVNLADLRREYAAVLLAFGLEGMVSLGKAAGVVDALAFLRQVKTGFLKSLPDRVAVLGGGNTAIDAAVTARKLGSQDVYLVYRRSFMEMPAWSKERERCLESGVHLLLLTQPLGYELDGGGDLIGLKIQRTELGEDDSSGRRRPIPIPGSQSLLKVDMVIEALGQNIPEPLRESLKGLVFTEAGLLARKANSYATWLENVFAAGDLINGGTTAVQGITEGMQAAEEIDATLLYR